MLDLAPNRVAAIAAFLTSIAGQIVALAGVFGDNDYAQAAVVIAGFIGQAAVVLRFLTGTQKHEERTFDPLHSDDELLADTTIDEDMGADEPGGADDYR